MKKSLLTFEELAELIVGGTSVVGGIVLGAISGGWQVALLAAFHYAFLGVSLNCVIAPRVVFRSRIYSRQTEYYATGVKYPISSITLMPLGLAVGSWVLVWSARHFGFTEHRSLIWICPAILTLVCAPFGIARLLWADKWWLRQYGR